MVILLFFGIMFLLAIILSRGYHKIKKEIKRMGFTQELTYHYYFHEFYFSESLFSPIEQIAISKTLEDLPNLKLVKYNRASFFVIQYLNYLPMKKVIDEEDFKKFLISLPFTTKNSIKELVKLFLQVKERAENINIPDECRAETTPWEFFRVYFLDWWIRETERYEKDKEKEKSKERYKKVNYVYEKIYKFFREFDSAPRIHGARVVELENLLEENRKILPINREDVIKLINKWRKYKIECYF